MSSESLKASVQIRVRQECLKIKNPNHFDASTTFLKSQLGQSCDSVTWVDLDNGLESLRH